MCKKQVMADIYIQLAKGNRIKARDLAVMGGIVESNDTSPATRSIIKTLINDGHVIGSNRNGYKLMTSGKEVQRYLNSLLKRQMGISRRIQAVYESATSRGIL